MRPNGYLPLVRGWRAHVFENALFYRADLLKIDLGLLQDDKPVPGDWVLIHVGFAMSKISEQDAADQMNTLRMLGEMDGTMQEVKGYGLEEVN